MLFTECPQCYQELKAKSYDTYSLLEEVESIIFRLVTEISPYEPRLNIQEDKVESIVDLVQRYSQQHGMLQMQVANLTALINEILHQKVMQLQEIIRRLETVSTPVFIQALAAEELMNRIIEEFLVSRQEINLLADLYIPTISQHLTNINSSHTVSMEVLQSLTSQVELLSTQANHISGLILELQYVVSMSLRAVEAIDILNRNTQEVTTFIHYNLTSIHQNVNSLMEQLQYFEMSLMQINIHVKDQKNSIPNISSSEGLLVLRGNLSTVQNTITDIEDEITEKQNEVYLLRDTLTNYSIRVDSLTQDISEYKSQTARFEEHAQTASNLTTNANNDIQQKLSEAEEVLENLQTYTNDTFEVARRANEALDSVTQISETASNAIETTTAIQQNVSEVMSIVQDAMDKANNAENITSVAQMVSFH